MQELWIQPVRTSAVCKDHKEFGKKINESDRQTLGNKGKFML